MARNYDYHIVTSSSDYWVDFSDERTENEIIGLKNEMMATRLNELYSAPHDQAWRDICEAADYAPDDLREFAKWLGEYDA